MSMRKFIVNTTLLLVGFLILPNNVLAADLFDDLIASIMAAPFGVINDASLVSDNSGGMEVTNDQPVITNEGSGDGFHWECSGWTDPHSGVYASYCTKVEGEGVDECTNYQELCSGPNDGKHMECTVTEWGPHCMVVEGEGENTCEESTLCSTDSDGWHRGCILNEYHNNEIECAWVQGEAEDKCIRNAECRELYNNQHTECVDGSCVWVEGGVHYNYCSDNSDCQRNSTNKLVEFGGAIKNFFVNIWAGFLSLFKK